MEWTLNVTIPTSTELTAPHNIDIRHNYSAHRSNNSNFSRERLLLQLITTMSVFRPNARALITGGASGIGYAVAQHCLKSSMKVTIVDYNQETLDLARQNLKGDVECLKSDVSDLSAWKSLKDKIGDVDFLMLNAGRMVRGSWGESEYFEQVGQGRDGV